MPIPKRKTITFERKKETANAVQFKEIQEEGEPEIAGSLYLKKWYCEQAQTVRIEIELDAI